MKRETENEYRRRILRVLVHLQRHLDEATSLDELAAVACFSPYHFHRIFRGMVGESVMEHVRRLRLERAAWRLKFTSQSVTEIAFSAGYEAHEAFTRAFGEMFGVPPSRFREEHRRLSYPEAPSKVHYDEGARVGGFEARPGEASGVRIERVEPRRVIFMRHVGPYDEVGQTWRKLMAWAGACGLGGGMTLGIVHDDPDVTPPERIRYDACLTVRREVLAEGEVGVQEVAGGDYAVATHRGPYRQLSETYARLCGEWLPSSGREPAGAPAWEHYRNAPQFTAPAV
jgi:AraC family transcriptional regulator